MLTVSSDDMFTLTPADVGDRLGRSARTVSRWCRLQWIRAVRLPNGDYRIPQSEVDAALQHGVPTPASPGARHLPSRDLDPTSSRLWRVVRKTPDDSGDDPKGNP